MKVLTAAEMGAADKASVEAGVSIAELMESAGEAVAAFCLRQYPQAAHVMVVCGKGNNGGDGLVAARLLAGEGVGVRVLLVGRQDDMKGDALGALEGLKAATSEDIVGELEDDADVEELAELLGEADLIVDAVVGTGFKPPLRGAAVLVRDALARVKVPVVAVDLPSGWDADSMEMDAEGAFRADAVVTFTAPKLAHVFGNMGTVVVGEIGTPDGAVPPGSLMWTGSSKAMTEQRRAVNANKGTYGHVLVVGGSYGTAGAPGMASLAALRAGAGLVTAAGPVCVVDGVGRIAPELMVRGLAQGAEGAVSRMTMEQMEALVKGMKVVAVGPGLSTKGEASDFVRDFVGATGCDELGHLPIVVDADGLNAFAGDNVGLLDGRGRTMVLTPHPGEMARLLGMTVAQVEKDRVGLARRFAVSHQVTLVLKGWRTLVAHPDGRVAANTSGNPALAKGGSGDILTGIVAAMLAQWPHQVQEAVEAAVFLHGLAADFAVRGMDEKFVLATDVIAKLSEAFGYRVEDADGLTWVCGLKRKTNTEGSEVAQRGTEDFG